MKLLKGRASFILPTYGAVFPVSVTSEELKLNARYINTTAQAKVSDVKHTENHFVLIIDGLVNVLII